MRAHEDLHELVGRMHARKVPPILVTDPEGRLLGVLHLDDSDAVLAQAHHGAATPTMNGSPPELSAATPLNDLRPTRSCDRRDELIRAAAWRCIGHAPCGARRPAPRCAKLQRIGRHCPGALPPVHTQKLSRTPQIVPINDKPPTENCWSAACAYARAGRKRRPMVAGAPSGRSFCSMWSGSSTR